ncbi:MAG: exo-beta-N-acetylmuramidase NamZ domain-containing protein [Limisphaerales bacterium]
MLNESRCGIVVGWWYAMALGLLVGVADLAVGAEFKLGSEVLAARGFRELQGKRVGLLTNPSGVNREGVWIVDVLKSSPQVNLVALFGPEHGLYGVVKAGEKVEGGRDKATGLPVHSLYGAARKPTPEMLKGLDVLVYDLQDTGTRSYTYISTMGLAMEACAEADLEFVVLDRPNPLGGVRVEGPMVEEDFRSFISRWDVPYVYGMTCGELARMINDEGWIRRKCRLTVVPMQGWARDMTWKDTGLEWVATSPNIPNVDAVFGYPSLGLLGEVAGGTGLTIGGVVKRPFQTVGADWLSAATLVKELQRAKLPGLRFIAREYAGSRSVLGCMDIVVTDPVSAPLVAVNFHVLEAVKKVSGRDLLREAERSGKSLALFDKAAGSDRWRAKWRGGVKASSLVQSWKAGEEEFRKARWPYLIYRGKKEIFGGSAPGKKARSREVEIQRGDTVFRIANEHGVTVKEVMKLNPGLDPTRLQVGMRLRVPLR